jgi:hypothetical protein
LVFIGLVILLIAETFLISGLIYLIIIKFKSKIKYKDTYNVCTYSMIPGIIVGILTMGFGGLAIIYSVVLMIFGVSKIHNVSKLKATITCSFSVILVYGINALIFIVLLESGLLSWMP